MNADSPTLTRHGLMSPLHEVGRSGLDVRSVWPAPDPVSMVLDAWGLPVVTRVAGRLAMSWPAPDPLALVSTDHPRRVIARSELVEPIHPVSRPDIVDARTATDVRSGAWAPPSAATLDTAWFPADEHLTRHAGRSGFARRVAIGFAAVAGAACAAVAVAVALF